jgi:hypothetical protein
MANIRIWGIASGTPSITDVLELQQDADGTSLKATIGDIAGVPGLTFVAPNLGTPASGILTNCTAFTLTTTGTSGAATYVSGTLNIPQYAGGGGTPGGLDTQVQFNDSSTFGGNSGFSYDKTNQSVGIGDIPLPAAGINVAKNTTANSAAAGFFFVASSGNNPVGIGLELDASGNGAAQNIFCLDFDISYNGAGSVSNLVGVNSNVGVTSGTVDAAYAVRGQSISVSGGTLTEGYGIKVEDQTAGGTNYSCWFGAGLYHYDALTASAVTLTDASNNLTSVVLPADATKYLDGTGAFTVPSGGGTVTHTGGALTLDSVVLGAGSADIKVTATGTGVVAALGINTGTAGAFVVNGGALGTPSSGTLTSCTAFTLTTTGTSGAATYSAGTLNIPQYTGGAGTVTHTGNLTANALVLGNAVADVTAMGSLGTTTTVLHGNASGAPTFAAVDLANDVTGSLPQLINAQTGTSYTVVAGDQGKVVTFSNAAAIAVTLPQATGSFTTGWSAMLVNLGAGVVTITPTTSNISGRSTVTLGKFESIYVASDGTNYQAGADTSNVRLTGVPFGIGDLTNAISTNAQSFWYVVPYSGTIIGWSIAVDAGTCTIKFCRKASGTAVPTISDSINTSGVAISSGTLVESTTVSDFTSTTVTAGDIIIAIATAVATAKGINAQLVIRKT